MKTGFFEEAPGVQSMIRLLSFLSFFVATYIAIYTIMVGADPDPQNMTFFGFFMVGAFVPKFIQKFAEMKLKDNGSSETKTTKISSETKTESNP